MIDSTYSDLRVSDLFTGDTELVSPPNLYFELNKIIDQPNKTVVDASIIIEKDPNLTAKLLKIVNSAFFGFPSQITTMTRAISLVGLTELKNLVLSMLIMEKFSSMPGGMMSIYDFWGISLRCALIAKQLTVQFSDNERAESIFICGLLHEIGLLVFYRKIPELARVSGLLVQSAQISEVSAERRIIGFDHYQAGAELANCWKLPEIIVSTIKNHCTPQQAGQFINEASIIRLASQISKKCSFGESSGPLPGLDNLGLPDEVIRSIIQQTDEQFNEIRKLFCAK